jgi:hypothetical protein
MSRTLILPGLLLMAVGLQSGPLRLGRPPGDIVVVVFIFESRHARTPDETGKASPGHATGEQFAKLTRAANVERWPGSLPPM